MDLLAVFFGAVTFFNSINQSVYTSGSFVESLPVVSIHTTNVLAAETKMTTSSAKPENIPKPTPTPKVGDGLLIDELNNFRASKGLSAVKNDQYTCDFAKVRAKEIISSFNHDGFVNRLSSHSLPYPGFHEVVENIAMNTSESQVIPNWINSPGHAANMQKDTPFVCIAKAGDFYAYEGYKP